MSKISLLTWIVIALMFVLFVPAIFSEGMFVDGLTYAALARNWVEGRGTFWFLHYTNDLLADFHSHPPFGMTGLALGYYLFGDSHYVEILYSILTGILAAWGMYKIGKLYHPLLGSLSILFWLLIPLVPWAFRSNMLENTLCVFTTWAVYALLLCLKAKKSFIFIFVSGILLCLGFLTKGPTALFPFCLPILYGILFREKWLFHISTFMLQIISFFAAFFTIFYSSKGAKKSILMYLNNAIQNAQNHTVLRHTYIIEELFVQILPILGIVALMVGFSFYQQKKNIFKTHSLLKVALFFILLGSSGVFPIMLSNKQSGYYMLPALSFWALGIAAFIVPFIEKRIEIWQEKYTRKVAITTFLVIIATFFIAIIGKENFSRDKEMRNDLAKVAAFVPEHANIYIHPSEHENWLLYAYFARFGDRSMIPYPRLKSDFYLLKKGEKMESPDFEQIPVELHYGTLWHVFR